VEGVVRHVGRLQERRHLMTAESASWIGASDVIPMFPTLVWKVQLSAVRRQAIETSVLTRLDAMRPKAGTLAAGQGWQSDQTLQTLGEFRDLVGCINDLAKSALRFLRVGAERFEITACWANVLAPGAAHRMHSHPNNFLSGVYYVRTHPGGDTINFHDPRSQTGIIRPPVVELTAENTDQIVVRVADGTLLMFPAYLQHSVDANRSEQERVSISFNIMFSSFTEELSKPLW
jgi:uncharacterized protein (TIGR02466 family)